MEFTQVPVRADGVLEAEVDGQRVLMSPEGLTYFGLVGSGPDVWDLVDGRRTLGQLLSEVVARYDGDPEVIRADVVDFLGGLERAGLLLAG